MARPKNPVFVPKDKWPDKTRINPSVKLPYAYKPDKSNPLILHADMSIVKFLEQGLDMIDAGSSYREAAEFVTSKLGKSISHQGMGNIWGQKRRNQRNNPRAIEIRANRNNKNTTLTVEEKYEARAVLKLAAAKRSATVAAKKLVEATKRKNTKLGLIELKDESKHIEYSITGPPIISEPAFVPNPGPQTEFLAAIEQEVLYGGAAGGLMLRPFFATFFK